MLGLFKASPHRKSGETTPPNDFINFENPTFSIEIPPFRPKTPPFRTPFRRLFGPLFEVKIEKPPLFDRKAPLFENFQTQKNRSFGQFLMSGCISFHSIPLHFDDIVPGNDFRDAWTQGCIIILDQLPWPIVFGHVFVHHATKYRHPRRRGQEQGQSPCERRGAGKVSSP